MAKRKYLVLFRNQASGDAGPSPEQLEQQFALYKEWMKKFRDDILDLGDKLRPQGRVVTASAVADGPFVAANEVVGGYMIIAAENYERAVELVRACPAVQAPGARLEIREMAGAKM